MSREHLRNINISVLGPLAVVEAKSRLGRRESLIPAVLAMRVEVAATVEAITLPSTDTLAPAMSCSLLLAAQVRR
jgi:hypothetical protein